MSLAYKAVLTDFDGVILNSSSIKTKAFVSFFSRFSAVRDAMVRFHYSHKGISRYEQFRHLARLLGRDEAFVSQVSDEFSRFVVHQVQTAPLLPGALTLLRRLREHNIPTHLVSNTPSRELVDIVNAKGLDSYFDSIHGSTQTSNKSATLAAVLEICHYRTNDVVYIGDTLQDYDSAVRAGDLPFIGLANPLAVFPDHVSIANSLVHVTQMLGLEQHRC